jgi:hypothetical protein
MAMLPGNDVDEIAELQLEANLRARHTRRARAGREFRFRRAGKEGTMVLRAVLLFSAALLIGAALGLYEDGVPGGFWLTVLAGFLGSWGCCPFSQPLLKRHRDLGKP